MMYSVNRRAVDEVKASASIKDCSLHITVQQCSACKQTFEQTFEGYKLRPRHWVESFSKEFVSST